MIRRDRLGMVLLLLFVLGTAGCATSVRYVQYTGKKFPPKSKYYFITVYPASQKLPATQPYYVIGRVEVSGYRNDGIRPETLMDQAKTIARKKGADAIINAKTEIIPYSGMYIEPGYYGYHYYHPAEYIPYNNALLIFNGELIVFAPSQAKEGE